MVGFANSGAALLVIPTSAFPTESDEVDRKANSARFLWTFTNCISVFCGVSVDGFLARPNHALDFLDAGGQEPHGFDEFYGSVDVAVIGRKTFEVVLGFGQWAYGKKQVVVLSSGPVDFSAVKGGVVEQMSGEPAEIAAQLKARGFKHAYIDGGITIQRFLAAGVINRLVITRVPVLIGEGIPLFGPLPHDVSLHHVATRTYQGGLVQSEYEIHTARRTRGEKNRTVISRKKISAGRKQQSS